MKLIKGVGDAFVKALNEAGKGNDVTFPNTVKLSTEYRTYADVEPAEFNSNFAIVRGIEPVVAKALEPYNKLNAIPVAYNKIGAEDEVIVKWITDPVALLSETV